MRPGYIDDKEVIQKRLRKVEGQVRGIQRMVDEDRYCIEILEQVSAATKALQAVALGLLDDHLAHCVSDAVRKGGDEASREAERGFRGDRTARPLLAPCWRQPPSWWISGARCVKRSSCSGRPSGRSSSALGSRVLSRPSSAASPCSASSGITDRVPSPAPPSTAWCRRRAPTPPPPWRNRCSSRAPTTSPPWCSCSPRPTWSSNWASCWSC